ncbi:putative UDP-N-acetylglucosamine pyrophosphorylase [Aphelenchoides fujianensis]|nr:putative UDP-N-acetylglucosamine pyrophosphorylase [Aphelenchoides fujianensis]
MARPSFEHDGVAYPVFAPPANAHFTEIPDDRYFVRHTANVDLINEYRQRGLEAIAHGRLCVLVLCGGQASRLGALQPKGTLSLKLGGRFDTLLRLQAAQIVRLLYLARTEVRESQPRIIWAVMVSQSTESAIRQHLNQICAEFQLPREDVIVFRQGETPCFDLQGNVLYKSKDQIQTAPNGNGGLYDALRVPLPELKNKSVLEELEERGVRYFHTYCVDNILCRVGDPVFIGFSIIKGADCAAKVVEKKDPTEKVGVICMNGDRPAVVEYSEITKEMSERRTADGKKLAFRAGNIANHFFTLPFMKNTINHPLDYHLAEKKIAYFDRQISRTITPDKPNGIKLERFIFDVFPLAREFHVFQVEPSEEFSPLKNGDDVGVDCPRTCINDLLKLHSEWLRRAHVNAGRPLYVSPITSYEGESLNSDRVRHEAGICRGNWIDLLPDGY